MGEIAVLKPNALIGQEEVAVLKASLFKGFTDPEVNYALAICNQLSLSPLLRQIHFVKRKNKDGTSTIAAQTGIDGFRLAAQRAGGYAGSEDAVFEFGQDKKRPIKATVTVYKMVDSQRCAFTASARWDEYYNPSGGQWDRMPCVMLSKCAEALALRKAFPAELSALRSDEEMHQADGPSKAQAIQERVIDAVKPDIQTTATTVEPEEPGELAEPAEEFVAPFCSLCEAEMRKAKSGLSFYCPNFNDGKGEHPRVRI